MVPLPREVHFSVGAEVLRALAVDRHVLVGDRADVVLGEGVGVAGGEALDVARLDVGDAVLGAPDRDLQLVTLARALGGQRERGGVGRGRRGGAELRARARRRRGRRRTRSPRPSSACAQCKNARRCGRRLPRRRPAGPFECSRRCGARARGVDRRPVVKDRVAGGLDPVDEAHRVEDDRVVGDGVDAVTSSVPSSTRSRSSGHSEEGSSGSSPSAAIWTSSSIRTGPRSSRSARSSKR